MVFPLFAGALLVGVVLRVPVIGVSTPTSRLVSALAFLLGVAVLRDAVGRPVGGLSALALLPVLYVAVRGSRRELAVVVVSVAAVFALPNLMIGGPRYPRELWQTAGFASVVAGIAGLVVQNLVGRVREQARDAVRRQHELEMLLDLFREISSAADVRAAVCDAARVVSRAPACVLLERDGQDCLVATAAAGARIDDVCLDQPGEAVTRMLHGGPGAVVSTPDAALGAGLVAALGHPAHVTLEPVLGPGVTGLLALAVRHSVERRGETLALLATEAATAIGRADVVVELENLARIDPLTGLPNRRAWDEALSGAIARSARDGRSLSVAVLDIDAFKEFNDTHGHQAGDRVLQETAAAWRAELRDGDVLARWGGDEFALLVNAPAAGAQRLVRRLRASLHEPSSSAGVVEWDGAEDAENVLERADAALYAAKAAGRSAARC